LLHFLESGKPVFALIDFGLAVRSGSWGREWRNSNLAGDPRYWPPAAWMAFAFGFKYVATHPNPGFQQQYVTRMDHFSVGVLGLEILFALWYKGEAYDNGCPGLLEVRNAWAKYWINVTHLFQLFHRQGPQDVRQHLAQSKDEGINDLVSGQKQLRLSLRAAAAHAQNSMCAPLLTVLAELIDENGSLSWNDLPATLSSEEVAIEAQSPAQPPSSAPSAPSAPPKFAHQRVRSTGCTLDQELRRFEPDVSETKTRAVTSGAAAGSSRGIASANLQGFRSADPLSGTFSHGRQVSGYI